MEQIKLLNKKLEDAEKAKDQAEQNGYDVGVIEIEKALKAEVLGVCKAYCLQVWNEAFNLAGVEASSSLRIVENVYYPPIIQALSSSASPDDAAPNITSAIEEASSKDPLHSSSPQEVAEQADSTDKEKEVSKEVASEMINPSTCLRILPRKGWVLKT